MAKDANSVNQPRREAFERRAREEAARLGGWYQTGLGDGRDKEGKFIYFHMYKHTDGRSATVWYPGGHCDNADLAEALRLSDQIRAPIKTALLPRIAFAFSRLAYMLVKASVKLFLSESRGTK
jgi:hypothetical protein